MAKSPHAPVTTLDELDALDEADMVDGHRSAERGDPEPGGNHSRAYHHGWRTRMMDLREIPCPPEHMQLVRDLLARNRVKGPAMADETQSANDNPRPLDGTPPWEDERVIARCHEFCKRDDGSPCDGPETDCTMGNCHIMAKVGSEFGYVW